MIENHNYDGAKRIYYFLIIIILICLKTTKCVLQAAELYSVRVDIFRDIRSLVET